jgi:predicted acylesterase/phospholipase RssA
LALSGGGAHGAFGAGFIYGWTEMSTMPEFKIVTGISTGALIACLTFLGAKHNEKLREVFMTFTPKTDPFKMRKKLL